MQRQQIISKMRECFMWMKKTPFPATGLFCNRTWDDLMCWPDIPAGIVAEKSCPDYINGFSPNAMATKICHSNGSWYVSPNTSRPWTNFSSCVPEKSTNVPEFIKDHLPHVMLMSNIGYGISLISLIAAVIIMIGCKRLHCSRNTVHINLFMSFILRAFISFLKEQLLVEGVGFAKDVHYVNTQIHFNKDGSHWECRLFFTIFYYALLANYMWIFVEGLYLHILILVTVFSEKSNLHWYILTGWGLPVVFVIPWIVMRINKDNVLCWNTHPKPDLFWIIKGPIVATIIVNFLFFLNIVRILFTKLNAAHYPDRRKFRYRKLAKSTLILIPLFGVHYICFISLPAKLAGEAQLVKLSIEIFFNSFQGFAVALLFCFLNGEVRAEMRKRWERSALRRHSESIRVRLGSLQMSTVRFGSPNRTSFDSRVDDSSLSFTTAPKKKNGNLNIIPEGSELETEPLTMANAKKVIYSDGSANEIPGEEGLTFVNCNRSTFNAVNDSELNNGTQDSGILECTNDESEFKNNLIDYHSDIPLSEYEKLQNPLQGSSFCNQSTLREAHIMCPSQKQDCHLVGDFDESEYCRTHHKHMPNCGLVIENTNANNRLFEDGICDSRNCNGREKFGKGCHVVSVPDVVMMNQYLEFHAPGCCSSQRKTNSENDIKKHCYCSVAIGLLQDHRCTSVDTDSGHCGEGDSCPSEGVLIQRHGGRRPLSTGSIRVPLMRDAGVGDRKLIDCDIIENNHVYQRCARSCSNIGHNS